MNALPATKSVAGIFNALVLNLFLSDVHSLKKGIISTPKKAPHIILLVGETGVGKSSLLELIGNVLIGNDIDHYDFDILDQSNEQGSPHNQTKSALLYTRTSNNGVVVRILDTPGFTDTRCPQQDELCKQNIATQIKEHIDSITAVLVVANGTVPGITVGTSHALSTLSTILPRTLANKIGVVLTNVSSPLHCNFGCNAVPPLLNGAPQFLLSNPIPLQKKIVKCKGAPGTKERAVADAEQHALETLVDLFDWLDGLTAARASGGTQLRRVTQLALSRVARTLSMT